MVLVRIAVGMAIAVSVAVPLQPLRPVIVVVFAAVLLLLSGWRVSDGHRLMDHRSGPC